MGVEHVDLVNAVQISMAYVLSQLLDLLCPLCHLEICYRVHSIPPLAPVLSQINPVHALALCFGEIGF
jgi:hypothetical protein